MVLKQQKRRASPRAGPLLLSMDAQLQPMVAPQFMHL